MSVYIPGMEMPKSCLVCSCNGTEYGECVLDPEKRCPENYGKIADWCPLVPVPPHGRLIDADALLKILRHYFAKGEARNAFEGLVRTEPTIIPASGGKEYE